MPSEHRSRRVATQSISGVLWRGAFVLAVVLLTLGTTVTPVVAVERPHPVSGTDRSVVHDVVDGVSDIPNAMVVTQNGEVVAAGSSAEAGSGRPLVLRLGADGSEQWSYVDASRYGTLEDVVETADGGIVAVGRSSETALTGRELSAVRLSAAGEEEWHLTFDDGLSGVFRGATIAADGDIVAAGVVESGGDHTVRVVKLAPDGTVGWDRAYFVGEGYRTRDVVRYGDDVVVIGRTPSVEGDISDGFAMALDGSGEVRWTTTLDVSYSDAFTRGVETDTGTLLLSGQVSSGGDTPLWIVELDANGEVRSNQWFAGPADGGRLYAGETSDIVSLGDDSFAIVTEYTSADRTIRFAPVLITLRAAGDDDGVSAESMHVFAPGTATSIGDLGYADGRFLAVNGLFNVAGGDVRVDDDEQTIDLWFATIESVDPSTAGGDLPVRESTGIGDTEIGGLSLMTLLLGAGALVMLLLVLVVLGLWRRRGRKPGGPKTAV